MGLEDILDAWAHEPDMIDPIDDHGNGVLVGGKFSRWHVVTFVAIGLLVFFPAALWSTHGERIAWVVVGLVVWGSSASALLAPRARRGLGR